MVYSGGLKIYCAVDPEIQQIVEEYYSNVKNFADSEAQSSIVIMDPSDGRVMAVAGGRDSWNSVLAGRRNRRKDIKLFTQPRYAKPETTWFYN